MPVESGALISKILIGLYVLMTSSALIFLKLGASSGSVVSLVSSKLHFNLNFYALLGICLYGGSFVLYTYLISKYDLGYIIPLTTAFVYIFIFTASYLVFNEVFTAAKILGITLILGGLILLNIK